MISYEPNRPRTAIALVAAALTAITIGVLVVVPAKFDSSQEQARMLAVAKARQAPPIEVAISPAQINVVGVREPELASAQPERPVIVPLSTR
jgi:predicted kinase